MLASRAGAGARAARRSAVELLFTVGEEHALRAPRRSTSPQLRSRFGYVFDHASPIGEIVARLADLLPDRRRASAAGAAHAGIRPEDGPQRDRRRRARDRRDARSGASTRRRPRTSARSTAAPAINVVPERCRVAAEARSLDEAQGRGASSREIVDRLHRRRQRRRVRPRRRRRSGCSTATGTSRDAPRVRAAEAALRACGYEPRHIVTGGGSDANALRGAPASRASTSPTAPSATTSPTSASPSPRWRGCSTSRFALLDHAARRVSSAEDARGAATPRRSSRRGGRG